MAKVDRIKEEIGWLKLVFGILVAIDVSLVGWLAQHYATASRVIVLAAVLATAVGNVRRCAGQPPGVPSHRATGGPLMVWAVVAALTVLLVGLLLVVREATVHNKD